MIKKPRTECEQCTAQICLEFISLIQISSDLTIYICHTIWFHLSFETSHKHNRFGRAPQNDFIILWLKTNLSKEREFVSFNIINVISFHCFVVATLEHGSRDKIIYCQTHLLKKSPFSSLPDSQVSDGKLVPQEDYKNDYTHVGFTHMNVKDWIDKINSILI